MSQKVSPKLLTLAFSVLALCFLAIFYIFAWTEPSVAPPGGNVAAPINVSSTAQTKTGRLSFTEFYDSNNTSYYVNPAGTISAILAGNVGIGTTSPPSQLLEVSGVDAKTLVTGSRAGAIQLRESFGTVTWSEWQQYHDVLRLNANDGTTTRADLITITADGKVGIGTTNPDRPLVVKGSASGVHSAAFVELNNIGVALGGWTTGSSTYSSIQGADLDYPETDPNRYTNLAINVSGGNVGIGELDPDRKFFVKGPADTGLHTGALVGPSNIGVALGGLTYDGTNYYSSIQGVDLTLTPPARFRDLIINPGGGNVGIGTDDPKTRLTVAGLTGTISGVDLRYITSTGAIYYFSSSERYKNDIQPFQDDFFKILQIEPKSFIDNATGQKGIGYIAEDLDELGLKYLVGYKDGIPDTIDYNGIVLYLLETVKAQQRQINELKASLDK